MISIGGFNFRLFNLQILSLNRTIKHPNIDLTVLDFVEYILFAFNLIHFWPVVKKTDAVRGLQR